MKDLILDLKAEGINTLPLGYINSKFVHPDKYAHLLVKGISDDDIDKLLSDGFNKAIALMHGPCNPYVMCLDFDEKNAPGANLFEAWRHLIDEDLFRKLVVERTRSKGFHVYFECKKRPAVKALASSPTGEEWIAIRSAASSGITYCAPSPGYTEYQGSLFDMQLLSEEDMFSLCSAAGQLDQYTGFKTAKTTALAPARVPQKFNAIATAFDIQVEEHLIPDYLSAMGWTTDGLVRVKPVNGEKWEYIRMWRPGRATREPYSANYWINKKRLSVFSSSAGMPGFDSGSSFSHSPSAVIMYTSGGDWEAAAKKIIELSAAHEIKLPETLPLAYCTVRGKSEYWQVEIKGVMDWAVRSGFQWMSLSSEDAGAVQLIRVVDNVIYEVEEKDILRLFCNEIERNYTDPEASRVLNRFVPQIMKYMPVLPAFSQDIICDKKDSSYICFLNGVLQVSSAQARLIKYNELPGCVFSRHIKNFEYRQTASHGVFGEFIKIISIDDAHQKFIMSTLGYLLHNYKLRNMAKAVMIIEDVEDQEEARGRSGKGLIAQFVEWIRWSVQQDGRNYKNDSQFKMQRITPGVQVYYLNDPAPGVLMNQFYNFITDDWTVEAKGKKSYVIPFKHSPKLMITTNYLPPLESDSDKDRFVVMPIKKFFGASKTLKDEFPGVIFFDESWPPYDRDGAINFAIDCLKIYLSESIISYSNKQLEENASKRLIRNSVPDAIIEVVDQGIDAAKTAKNTHEFEQAIRIYDLRRDQVDSITKVFDWEPGRLIIHRSAMYQYCLRGYNLTKMIDKVFGRKLKMYIEKGGFETVEEVRNNVSGRRIVLKISAIIFSECDNLMALEVKKGGFDPVAGVDPF